MSDEVRGAYDAWASSYDADPNRTRDLDGALVRALPDEWAALDVVEAGCGTGKNTAFLAGRCRSLVGLDFSEEMLAVARARVPNARLLQADLTKAWPVPPTSADLVLIDLVLEHIDDLAAVFAEAARVLRPGGQVRICELHPDRQLRGSQAQFEREGARVLVPAFVHAQQDYAKAAITAGFEVIGAADHGDSADPTPRVLEMRFRRP